MAIGAVVESVCKGRGSSSSGRRCSFGIGHELASILPRFPHFLATLFVGIDHDRGLIVRRLGVDLAADLHENISGDRGVDSASNAPRSRLDRGAIAVRSDRDRGVLPRFVCTVRWISGKWTISISRSSRDHDE